MTLEKSAEPWGLGRLGFAALAHRACFIPAAAMAPKISEQKFFFFTRPLHLWDGVHLFSLCTRTKNQFKNQLYSEPGMLLNFTVALNPMSQTASPSQHPSKRFWTHSLYFQALWSQWMTPKTSAQTQAYCVLCIAGGSLSIFLVLLRQGPM